SPARPGRRTGCSDPGGGPVGAEDGAQPVGDLAQGGAGLDRLQDVRQQVLAAARRAFDGRERRLDRGPLAPLLERQETGPLLLLQAGIDLLDRHGWRRAFPSLVLEAVDADDHARPGVDLPLVPERGLLDLLLLEAGLDRPDRAADGVDPL